MNIKDTLNEDELNTNEVIVTQVTEILKILEQKTDGGIKPPYRRY